MFKTFQVAISMFCCLLIFNIPVTYMYADTPDATFEMAESKKLSTEDAPTVGKNVVELGLGYTFNRSTTSWGGNWERMHREELGEHWLEFGLTYGILDNVDVFLGIGYADLRDLEGIPDNGGGVTNLAYGLKWMFMENQLGSLYLSWIGGFAAPVGRYGTESHLGPADRYWSFDQGLVLTKGLFPKWVTDVELFGSIAFGEHKGRDRGTMGINWAIGYQWLEWLQPELELGFEHGFRHTEHDSDVFALTAGLIMPVKEGLIVGAGIQQGMAGRSEDQLTTALATLTWSFSI